MTAPVKEIPLPMPVMFGQHKRLMELEKKINSMDNHVFFRSVK
jgi:hypothetical protein